MGRGVTNVSLPSVCSRFLVRGPCGFSIPIRTQGGRLHSVSVYAEFQGALHFLATQHVSVPLEDKALSRLLATGPVNFLGSGFNPCFNEWRLRVADLNLAATAAVPQIPAPSVFDELLVPPELTISSADATVHTRTDIFTNISEWGAFSVRQWKFAAAHEIVGGGASFLSQLVDEGFSSDPDRRWAVSETTLPIFNAQFNKTVPLRLSPYPALEAAMLAPFNQVTKPMYYRFFDKFGVAFAKSLSLGRRAELLVSYAASQRGKIWEASQISSLFTLLTTTESDSAHRAAVATMDPELLQSARVQLRFVGGRAQAFNTSNLQEYLQTASSSLAVVDMELQNIWDLIEEPNVRKWMQEAALDYVRSCTPEHWRCSLENVALRTSGAQLIGASSRFLGEPDVAIFNLISAPEQQQSWGADGESNFLFGDGDALQYLILELPVARLVSKIAVELDPYPSPRGVWDFLRIDWAASSSAPFRTWGIVGEENGLVEVTKATYSLSVADPVRVKFVRFVFGSVRPQTNLGARIRRLYVFACSNRP